VARMKQDDILTCKFKGEKSLGRPRIGRKVAIKFYVTEILCGSGVDNGSLLSTVVHLHVPQVTVILTFVYRWKFSLFTEITIKWRS
jgi:hypothetical protein